MQHSLPQTIDLLITMTQKELKARYKRASFGLLWLILNPLLQMLIIGTIFSFFIKIPNYFLFLFSGLLPWQFFSLSLSKTTSSFVYESSLIKKARFPKEIIPISIILSNFINLLTSITLILTFLLVTGNFQILKLPLLLTGLIWLLAFTIGISLLTASLNVRYRDIAFFTQSVLILWFYATPILYNLNLIPQQIQPIFALNPMTSVFELFHLSLANQGSINPTLILSNLAITCIIIALGLSTFKRHHKYFIDWL